MDEREFRLRRRIDQLTDQRDAALELADRRAQQRDQWRDRYYRADRRAALAQHRLRTQKAHKR